MQQVQLSCGRRYLLNSLHIPEQSVSDFWILGKQSVVNSNHPTSWNKNLVTFQTVDFQKCMKRDFCNPWHRSNSEVNPLNSSKRPSCRGVGLKALKLLLSNSPYTVQNTKIQFAKKNTTVYKQSTHDYRIESLEIVVASQLPLQGPDSKLKSPVEMPAVSKGQAEVRQNCREAKISSITSILITHCIDKILPGSSAWSWHSSCGIC